MKTCGIKEVFHDIVRLKGLDPLTAGLTAAQKARTAELINQRVIQAYEDYMWPQLMLIEQRQYRPTWDAALNYATGDEVYHVDAEGASNYYVSLQDGNVNKEPDIETTWWAEAGDDFQRTISFTQDEETEIGAADIQDCVYDRDPRLYPGTEPLSDVRLYDDNILVASETAPYLPWIKFRPIPPVFSLTEWSAATNYAIADVCYLDAYGESYKALASSTNKNPYSETAYWEPVYFPLFLRDFVKYAVNADEMMDDQQKWQAEAKAQALLETLQERLIDGQGQRARAVYKAT